MLFKESQRHKTGGRRGQHCLSPASTNWKWVAPAKLAAGIGRGAVHKPDTGCRRERGTGYHSLGTYRSWTRQKKVNSSISPGQVGYGVSTTTNMTRKTLPWHASPRHITKIWSRSTTVKREYVLKFFCSVLRPLKRHTLATEHAADIRYRSTCIYPSPETRPTSFVSENSAARLLRRMVS